MATVAMKLHEMLLPLKEIADTPKKRQDVWAELARQEFGWNTVKMYGELSSARLEVARQLEEVSKRTGSHNYLLSQLDKIFDQLDVSKISAAWDCDVAAVDCLLTIDDLLTSSGYAEPDIDMDLEAVLARLMETRAELKSSDIDPEIKRFLMEAISSLVYAVQSFEVYGEAGLKRAYATSVGNLLAIKKIGLAENEEAQSIYDKVFKILGQFDVAFSVATNGLTIALATKALIS